jgi:hypothetical protein
VDAGVESLQAAVESRANIMDLCRMSIGVSSRILGTKFANRKDADKRYVSQPPNDLRFCCGACRSRRRPSESKIARGG